MSKELPFFKFNVSEWLTGNIAYESYETQGIFIKVCCEYWNRNNCLTIEEAKKRTRKNKEIDYLIENNFLIKKRNKISIKFLDEEKESVESKRLKLSIAGRKGGLSKGKATLKHKEEDKDKDKEEDKERDIYRSFKHLSLDKKDYKKLNTKWSKNQIDNVLDKIENYKLNKKYVSLYLTANVWLKKEHPIIDLTEKKLTDIEEWKKAKQKEIEIKRNQ